MKTGGSFSNVHKELSRDYVFYVFVVFFSGKLINVVHRKTLI